jgi:acyl transferase domain-containing protein
VVNRKLSFEDSPFFVSQQVVPFEGEIRRAGVSSFGIGGTNAHLVVEQAPVPAPRPRPEPLPVALPMSARTPQALAQVRAQLADHLHEHPELELDDVAWTLQTGRTRFDQRDAVVATDVPSAVAALRRSRPTPAAGSRRSSEVVLLLPGQGAQVPMMARHWWDLPEFRAAATPLIEEVREHTGLDLQPLLVSEREGAAELLAQTWVTQPLLFVVEVATAQVLVAWGLRPAAMLGHSVGELAAAHLSGVLSMPDAVKLVCARGRLMHGCPSGAMIAVPARWSDVAHLVADVELAAVNATSAITLAGTESAIAEAERVLEAAGVGSTRLHVSHAFHSALMEPALAEFQRIAETLTWSVPTIPFISCVTGDWITAEQATDPAYWASQIREPVQFQTGIATVTDAHHLPLIEAGPGRALGSFVSASVTGAGVVSTMTRDRATGEPLAPTQVQAALWQAGAELAWENTWPRPPRRVSLPG